MCAHNVRFLHSTHLNQQRNKIRECYRPPNKICHFGTAAGLSPPSTEGANTIDRDYFPEFQIEFLFWLHPRGDAPWQVLLTCTLFVINSYLGEVRHGCCCV